MLEGNQGFGGKESLMVQASKTICRLAIVARIMLTNRTAQPIRLSPNQ